MTQNKTAVIIGAGIGGIAIAIYLAKNGYEVCIHEKNLSPGGRCGQLIRDGHRFDLGATMLLMPGVYRQVFGELGISLEEGKDIVPLDDLYTIWFDNGEKIDFTSDEQRMKEQLEKIEPGSFGKSKKYVTSGYKIFRLGMDKLVGRNFYNIFQFANLKNIGLLIRLKTYDQIKKINPLLEPRYQLSLEIIFDLYLMVFERINIHHGKFTTEELNPTPDEIRQRVYDVIIRFRANK
jgi:Phytoene dehydrogenase and related proteins